MDISPVESIMGVARLYSGCSTDRGSKLADLSPLKGMKLTHLSCRFSPVSDLSPLEGMALTVLNCELSKVRGVRSGGCR